MNIIRPCANGPVIKIENLRMEPVFVEILSADQRFILYQDIVKPKNKPIAQRIYFWGSASYHINVYDQMRRKILLSATSLGYVDPPVPLVSHFTISDKIQYTEDPSRGLISTLFTIGTNMLSCGDDYIYSLFSRSKK